MGKKYIDLTGQRYGRLIVVAFAGRKVLPGNKRKYTYWLCTCDCGNQKEIEASNLRSGTTNSCGCWHKEMVGGINRKHNGRYDGRLYPLWKSIKYRCLCKTSKDYKNYGARGITICEEWANDYAAFREWALANGYKQERKNGRNVLTIDRIDVNGNYDPQNCRFVPEIVQAYNKRTTRRYEYKGKYLTIKDISNMSGLSISTTRSRLETYGYSVDEAINIAKGGRRVRKELQTSVCH